MRKVGVAYKNNLFIKGALDTIPLIIAATPFAILFGALYIEYGLSLLAAIGMSAQKRELFMLTCIAWR